MPTYSRFVSSKVGRVITDFWSHQWRLLETFNNFRNNSGNDIIVISDDEATDDKATDDEAEAIDYGISFNVDALEKQLGIESKDQVHTCKSNLFMLLYNHNLLYYYF